MATVIEQMTDPVVVTDAQRRILWVNQAFTRVTGYSREEALGKDPSFLQGPETDAATAERMHKSLERGVGFKETVLNYHKNGGTYWLQIEVQPLRDEQGKLTGFLSFQRDVSAMKKRDALLELSSAIAQTCLGLGDERQTINETLAQLGAGSGQDRAYLFEMHTADDRVVLSQRYEWARKGVSAEIDNPELHNIDLHEKLPTFAAGIFDNRVMVGSIEQFTGIERESMSGRGIQSLIAVPVYVEGKPWGLLGMDNCREEYRWTDGEITVLRAIASMLGAFFAHQRLQVESQHLHAAIEQSLGSVVITDVKGNTVYVNPGFEKATGYSRVEAIGKNPRILRSGVHDAEFFHVMWSVLKTGQVWQGRLVNKRKDGSLLHEHAIISPVKDGRGVITHYVAVKYDITREMEHEQKLLQAQKLDSVGRLAGGVAHDFNNMLAAIRINVELALDADKLEDDVREHLLSIQAAAERSASIIQQLLTFARQQRREPKCMDANAALEGLMKMLKRLIPEEVELKFEPGKDIPALWMDPGQFDQIIINLVVNARDAIYKKGEITLSTVPMDFSSLSVDKPAVLGPGRYARISVRDDGCGMDGTTMAHMMDPFFTTKEVGKGTGLGLSIIYSIVQQAGGGIVIESSQGSGSAFHIYLPAVRASDKDSPK